MSTTALVKDRWILRQPDVPHWASFDDDDLGCFPPAEKSRMDGKDRRFLLQ